MSLWYLYILECGDGTLYTGITVDPERRLADHNKGTGARYTRGRGPVTMVYCRKTESRSDALRLEYRVKRLSRRKKKALIAGGASLDAYLS